MLFFHISSDFACRDADYADFDTSSASRPTPFTGEFHSRTDAAKCKMIMKAYRLLATAQDNDSLMLSLYF
jgi:hypothetical protein